MMRAKATCDHAGEDKAGGHGLTSLFKPKPITLRLRSSHIDQEHESRRGEKAVRRETLTTGLIPRGRAAHAARPPLTPGAFRRAG